MDIPDLFSHVKEVMKGQAEVTEENPEKEMKSEMAVIIVFILFNEFKKQNRFSFLERFYIPFNICYFLKQISANLKLILNIRF